MTDISEANCIKDLQVPISSQQLEQLLDLQQEIIEKVAIGHDHQLILDDLCRSAESMLPGSLASIMLFDDLQKSLFVRSAPSIPENAIQELNGLVPDNYAGSCGTAVFKNEAQFICDTIVDKRWSAKAFQNFTQKFSVFACWSMPIRSRDNLAIGSFALSSTEKRKPHAFHKKLLETCAHIAGIVFQKEIVEQNLWLMAHHDSLTKLPNRVMFNLRLEHAIEHSVRTGKKIAVLFIDLDHFKNINDTLGHEAGDLAIIEATNRIRQCIRQDDTLSRMGGDEFTLIVEDLNDPLDISILAEKISHRLINSPFELNKHHYQISASIGISLYPDDGTSPSQLLQNADTAMYEAKRQGRNKFIYYENELTRLVEKRLELEGELRKAIQNNDFILHYQPQFSCNTIQLIGAEALIRWQHPTKGLIPPMDFIPIAEDTGLIEEIGSIAAYSACKQCVNWWNDGLPQFKISINLSAKQLTHHCANKLNELIENTKIPIDNFEIEVTESIILSHGSVAIEELQKISERGISIAMDDFGTGHSSLSQLKNLPINRLKIDRSFVSDIPQDENDVAIVKTIIAMAKTLGLSVIAEGVETEAQSAFLTAEGCDDLQGYLLGKPVDAKAFRTLLSNLDDSGRS